jgi:AcrR family transcriptional regulator
VSIAQFLELAFAIPWRSRDMPRQTADIMRKKPRQKRAEATLEAILAAAVQILAKGGEEALTIDKIAARAGASVGSIYQYFGSKDAILLELLRREREAIGARLAADLATARPPTLEAVARRVIRTLVETFRARRGRRKLIALVMLRAREDGGAEILDRVTAAILGAAAAFPDRSRPLSEVSAYVLTRAVMGPLRAAMIENRDVLDRPEFEEELVRLALAYLRE